MNSVKEQSPKVHKSWSQIVGSKEIGQLRNHIHTCDTDQTQTFSVDDEIKLANQQKTFVTFKKGVIDKRKKNTKQLVTSDTSDTSEIEEFPELTKSTTVLPQMRRIKRITTINDVAISDVAISDVATSDVATSDVSTSDVATSDVSTSDVASVKTLDIIDTYEDTQNTQDFQIVKSNRSRSRSAHRSQTLVKSHQNVSKFLSYLLRHGASELGVKMDHSGRVNVKDILALPQMTGITLEILEDIVRSNDKQRFGMKNISTVRTYPNGKSTTVDTMMIWANQGHSIDINNDILEEIITPLPICIHGTNLQAWKIIEKSGLNIMGRQYIHCAIAEPENNNVISGMRKDSKVLIYINMKKAMTDGIKFFMSTNNVILTKGIDGIIDPKYFQYVDHR
jgi:2'-phosphotransferase